MAGGKLSPMQKMKSLQGKRPLKRVFTPNLSIWSDSGGMTNMNKLMTIVQFYPEDTDFANMWKLLGKLHEQGTTFHIGQCECGHIDWYLNSEVTGPLSIQDIENEIKLAGLKYDVVIEPELIS